MVTRQQIGRKWYIRFDDGLEFEFENEAHLKEWEDYTDPDLAKRTESKAERVG